MFVSRRMLRRADAEEDLYAGFDEEAHPAFDTQTLAVDEAFQQAVQSSHGRGPPTSSGSTTAFRLATARSSAAMRRGGTANGRPVTGGEIARPVTAVRGAGFQSGASGIRGTNVGVFDPLNQAKSSPIVTLQLKDENDPKERIKDMEACINSLVEESVRDASKRNFKLALEKAKEAASRDRQLAKQREQILAGSPANMELSFCVSLNLALRYTDADMLSEALEIYQGIVQNRAFSNIGRLKLNMGNICFMQENFPKAVKFYRMALDQVPNMQKDLRIKILKNIGTAFVKMGQFADAITSFEYIMAEKCDIQAALHLILCHYMLGDVDKMKRAFIKLLDVDNASLEPTELAGGPPRNDLLHKMEQKRKRDTEFTIMTAANLITPVIFPTAAEGYDWCIEQMKASTNFSYLASDLELNKATAFLRKREFGKAIETLKSFEKRDNRNVSAANNLSYLYFMLDKRQAEKYADAAIAIDKYNAAALVNKGNCCFSRGNFGQAKEYYGEALQVEAGCVEALYNIGLSCERLKEREQALDFFLKFQAIVGLYPQALYKIGQQFEYAGDVNQSMEWYHQASTLLLSDPDLLNKLGAVCESQMDDIQQAAHYHGEAVRHYPSSLSTLEWLGGYHAEMHAFDEAVRCFEKAQLVQPAEPKWPLYIGSCYMRSGQFDDALRCYENVHRKFPENTDCLKMLVKITGDLELVEYEEYVTRLKKVEKLKEARVQSGRTSGGRRRKMVQGTARSIGSAEAVQSKVAQETSMPAEVEFDDLDDDFLPL
ncbi:intraflagellar transport protein 88 homolog isoform X2 [Varroa jacobsoni]|uniref:intraflagellar transport protein 88 homolog isoform X2 n=1 Tax=Varroa jacobsoni TaxID=62625 RepID=UPI000BF98294|nr:intraflagellar transport protein 88 homolog isoform X2 [Varroa jacobsoni]